MIRMTIVLSGNNDFARHAELKRLVSEFVASYGEFGLEYANAGETELGRLLENVSSTPFLAPRRMIVLRDIGTNKSLAEHVEEFLAAVAETTDLLIEERKFDKRLNLYKTLKKNTDFREFNELDERGLQTWLVGEASSRGGQLQPADARVLIERAGTNQLALSNELDKLLAYDDKVTRAVINQLVEPLPQGSVFDLLDAAFAGNRQKAMQLYDDQRRQQVEAQAIMGMIAWQVHIIAVCKLNEQAGVETIAREAKLNPYVVRKSLAAAKQKNSQDVKELVHKALKLDVRLKSENIDADDAVRHFLLTI